MEIGRQFFPSIVTQYLEFHLKKILNPTSQTKLDKVNGKCAIQVLDLNLMHDTMCGTVCMF